MIGLLSPLLSLMLSLCCCCSRCCLCAVNNSCWSAAAKSAWPGTGDVVMGVGVAGGRGTPEGEAWLEEVEDVENSVEAESTIAQVRQFCFFVMGVLSPIMYL